MNLGGLSTLGQLGVDPLPMPVATNPQGVA
jgi:hypothetical protein